MKKIKFFTLLFLIFASIGVQGCEFVRVSGRNHLNVFVSFESHDWNNAIIDSMARALDEGVPVICSSPLFKQFMQIKSWQYSLKIGLKYSLFINAERTLVVILPGIVKTSALGLYGFEKLDEIISYKSWQDVSENVLDIASEVLLSDFKKIFNPCMNISKRFIISGHGQNKKRMAGLPLEAFTDLFNILSDIQTDFVFFTSCYSGGLNLMALQKKIDAIQSSILRDQQKINYIVCINGTTDDVAIAELSYKDFFKALDVYFEQPNIFFGKSMYGISINDVLKFLHIDQMQPLNIASVRFPGTNSFFRSEDLNNITILTFLGAKKLRTGPLFSARFAKDNGPAPLVTIEKAVDYFLVYPCDVTGIVFDIYNPNMQWISKISGQAQHYLSYIAFYSQKDAVDTLVTSFLYPLGEYKNEPYEKRYAVGASEKAWFIKDVFFKAYSRVRKLEDVVINKYAATEFQQDKAHGCILFKEQENYYFVQGDNVNKAEDIGIELYCTMIADIFASTCASSAALYEATGGGQDITTQNDAFRQFAESYPQILKNGYLFKN